jgi:hypothetical protein
LLAKSKPANYHTMNLSEVARMMLLLPAQIRLPENG